MKTTRLSIGLIFIFAAIVFNNCAKEEMRLVPGPEGEISSLKKAMTSGYVPGTDITVQLRSDLENGLSVTLPAGHFYLSETVIIGGYPGGTIKGAGKDLTILETTEEYVVSENPFLPTGYKTSGIIELHNTVGDVTFKAMSFVVKGEHPAEAHLSPFIGNSTYIDNVIVVLGKEISLECKDLRITGEYVGDIEGAPSDYNIIWPIIGTGFGTDALFNHLSVKDCDIDGCGGSALDIWMGRTAEFRDNKITNAGIGIWLQDVYEAVTITDCHFENTPQAILKQVFVDCLCCFKDNTLDGQPMEDDCQ